MKIVYSPDTDVLTIQLRTGKPTDSRDAAEGIIVHLSAKGQPFSLLGGIRTCWKERGLWE